MTPRDPLPICDQVFDIPSKVVTLYIQGKVASRHNFNKYLHVYLQLSYENHLFIFRILCFLTNSVPIEGVSRTQHPITIFTLIALK